MMINGEVHIAITLWIQDTVAANLHVNILNNLQ